MSLCSHGILSLLVFSFSLFFFLSFRALSLSTVSISETSGQTLVCALSNRSSLQCSSFPPDSIRLPFDRNIRNRLTFSGVVSGNGFVCALTSPMGSNTSSVPCWRFSMNGTKMSYKTIYHGPELEELESGDSRVCGIERGSKRLRCWQPMIPSPGNLPEFSSVAVGDGFICGLSPLGKIACEGKDIANAPNGDHYTSIKAGFRHACAITRDNDLECWGQIENLTPPAPREKFMALALGDNRSCGLRLSNGTAVCWGSSNFSVPKTLENTPFISIQSSGRIFCGVVTANFSLYCWGNEEFKSRVFVPFQNVSSSAVLPGPCRRECPNGPFTGTQPFCRNGFRICQPYIGDGQNGSPTNQSPTQNPKKKISGGRNIIFIVIGCVGSVSLIIIVGIFLFRYCKYHCLCKVHDSGRLVDERGKPNIEKRLSHLVSIDNTRKLEEFSLDKLARCTNGFSVQSKIGVGSFGSVYHGVLTDGRHVAIKRAEITDLSSYGITRRRRDEREKERAFVNELDSLSRLNHKHLVRLIGFYEDSEEMILVYEYIDNFTLSHHLHNPSFTPLTWQMRVKIALEAARGIQYLHEYVVPPVIHRDIKSSNILLDGAWTTKVSDFGLSQMGPTGNVSHLSIPAAGTLGYIDPEYFRLERLTIKSDVYSFGVMLLELLSGLKAIHKNGNGNPRNVVDFVVPYILQDQIHRVLDRRIPPPTPSEIEAVASIGYVAACCVLPVSRDRPSMTEVVSSLEMALTACLTAPASGHFID